MNNRELLFCLDCNDKKWFDLEGNTKICQKCGIKSSYKQAPRKRWVYSKSYPDTESASPYNQECSDNAKRRFEELQERLPLLSAREREVIELLWEGKTQEEVSAILGIGQQRVSACLVKARHKLTVVKKPPTGR